MNHKFRIIYCLLTDEEASLDQHSVNSSQSFAKVRCASEHSKDGNHIRKRLAKVHWVSAEIVRKEACKLAIQHRYFSPEWFAEFKDYLHQGFPPYSKVFLEELCTIIATTEACRYCTRRRDGRCLLGLGEAD